SVSFVFFFQAEDGIRDGHVTGVQACALPIGAHRTGELASAPTTVVHGRTRHRVTSPLVTYGSARTKRTAGSADSPLNNNTALSAGSASAPPRTNSPRSTACQARLRCSLRNSARRSM